MARRERRLTKREKKATGERGTFEDRAHVLAKEAGVTAVGFGADADGRPSMSEVLGEWAGPLLDPLAQDDLSRFTRALAFASLVWNAATMSEEPAAAVADGVFAETAEMDVPMPPRLRPIVVALVDARRSAYGDDPRVIITTDARDVDGERRVQVAWALL